MSVEKLVNFEPARNEWYLIMNIEGKAKAAYLGVQWEDQVEAAIKKAREVMATISQPLPEEDAYSAGLMYDMGVSNLYGSQQYRMEQCFDTDNYTF